MSGVPDYTLEDTLDFKFSTRQFSSGTPFAFASGAIEIYEDNSTTQITGAETLTLEFDGVTGLHNLRVAATAANGFENGKSYHCVVSAGTVDSVSVVGEVVQQFSIGRSAAAADLANGTDGLGAIKTDTAAILVDTEAATGVITDTEAIIADTEAAITERSTLLTDTEAVLTDTEAAITERSTLLTDTEAVLVDTEAAAPVLTDTEAIIADTEAAITARATLLTDTEAILTDTEAATAVLTDTEAILTDAEAILVDTEAATAVLTDTEAILTDSEAILTDTGTTLPALLPTALVGGKMDSNVGAISASTTAADKLEEGAEALAIGTVNDASPTTTSFVIALTGDTVDATDDHYNGRIITFTSGVLLQQSTDITDYTGATATVTVTALTEAPGNGDQFVIS